MTRIDQLSSPPSIVLFDWDNTIIEHGSDAVDIFVQETGICHNNFQTLVGHGLTFPQILSKLLKCDKKVEKAAIRYREIHDDVYRGKLPHVIHMSIDFLDLLKNDNKILCVVSNRDSITLKREIKALKLDGYFDTIVGAGNAEYSKPSPEPAFIALNGIRAPNQQTMRYDDQEVWFVGDSVADVQCANASGCVPILFSKKNVDLVEQVKIPYFLVENYTELINLYKKLR